MNQYEQERQQLEQRRRLLEAMQQRALGGSQGQMVGRTYVPDIAGSLANLGSAYFAGKGLKDIEGKDQEIEGRRRAELRTELEKFDTNPDGPAAAREALISAHPEMRQIGQILMSRKLSPQKKQELWEVLTPEQKQSLSLPVEDAYQREKTSGEVKKLDNATKIINQMPGMETQFGKDLGAEAVKELVKTRELAGNAEETLGIAEQMREIEKRGVFSGPTANIATGLTTFAESMGIPVSAEDKAKAANSTQMQQQIAKKVSAVLLSGSVGRSMTDADREAFEKSLPSLLSSPEGRAGVIRLMEEGAKADLEYFNQFSGGLRKQFPQYEGLLKLPTRPRQQIVVPKPSGAEQTVDGVTVKNWGS